MTETSKSSTTIDIFVCGLTCSNCGTAVKNEDPDIKHQLDFLEALRDKGWHIPSAGGAHGDNQLCPKCVSS